MICFPDNDETHEDGCSNDLVAGHHSQAFAQENDQWSYLLGQNIITLHQHTKSGDSELEVPVAPSPRVPNQWTWQRIKGQVTYNSCAFTTQRIMRTTYYIDLFSLEFLSHFLSQNVIGVALNARSGNSGLKARIAPEVKFISFISSGSFI